MNVIILCMRVHFFKLASRTRPITVIPFVVFICFPLVRPRGLLVTIDSYVHSILILMIIMMMMIIIIIIVVIMIVVIMVRIMMVTVM